MKKQQLQDVSAQAIKVVNAFVKLYSSGSRIVNAQINAKEAMISNNIGNIEIGMISKIAPIVNTPTINPTDPHFRILP